MKKNYKLTMTCCFGSYLVQSMVINFLPLLFITFHESFGIPLQQITLLVTVNFLTQLTVDFLAIFFIDKLGYKNGVLYSGYGGTGVPAGGHGNTFCGSAYQRDRVFHRRRPAGSAGQPYYGEHSLRQQGDGDEPAAFLL